MASVFPGATNASIEDHTIRGAIRAPRPLNSPSEPSPSRGNIATGTHPYDVSNALSSNAPLGKNSEGFELPNTAHNKTEHSQHGNPETANTGKRPSVHYQEDKNKILTSGISGIKEIATTISKTVTTPGGICRTVTEKSIEIQRPGFNASGYDGYDSSRSLDKPSHEDTNGYNKYSSQQDYTDRMEIPLKRRLPKLCESVIQHEFLCPNIIPKYMDIEIPILVPRFYELPFSVNIAPEDLAVFQNLSFSEKDLQDRNLDINLAKQMISQAVEHSLQSNMPPDPKS